MAYRRFWPAILLFLSLTGCASGVRRFPEGGPRLGWQGRIQSPAAGVEAATLQDFIRRTNRQLPAEMVERITAAIARESAARNLDARIVAAVIAKESSFNPRAYNPSGASGLGQLMPPTAKWLGVQDPFDPDQNVTGLCLYLSRLCEMWPGPHWERVLASYRLGQGTIRNALASTGQIPSEGLSYARSVLAVAEKLPGRLAANSEAVALSAD